ncbi:hypothetical protein ACOSQ4_023291 [Xanthoceras sorbifolium]
MGLGKCLYVWWENFLRLDKLTRRRFSHSHRECLSNNSAQAVGVIRDHKFGGWLRATSALRDCFSNPRRSTWSSKVDVPISSVHREEHSGDATQNPVEDSHGFDRIIADIVTVGSLATGKDKTVTSVEEIELQLIRYPILRRLLLDIHVRYFLPLMMVILNPLLSSNSSMWRESRFCLRRYQIGSWLFL